MAYRILEIELTDEQATRKSIAESEIAVVWRYRGYPVGFLASSLSAVPTISELIESEEEPRSREFLLSIRSWTRKAWILVPVAFGAFAAALLVLVLSH